MTNPSTNTRPFTIRELRPGDLEYIAAHLRPSDARELRATYGTTDYFERLTVSAAHTEELHVCEADGKPLAVFGIVPTTMYAAGIWFSGTTAMTKLRRHFVRESRAVINRWFEQRPELRTMMNFTHAENRMHHRWLQSVGGELFESEPRGANGEMFRLFTIRRAALCAIRD